MTGTGPAPRGRARGAPGGGRGARGRRGCPRACSRRTCWSRAGAGGRGTRAAEEEVTFSIDTIIDGWVCRKLTFETLEDSVLLTLYLF